MTWSHFWLCFLALSFTNIANVQARQALNHVNSICSTWGRHHFKTFDGDVYQFPGLCGYNLVSDCHEMYREFSVHIQKSLVDGHPTVNELVVTINDLVFHLTKRAVSLNGDLINLPYLNAGIQLERNAVYTKLQAKVGLVVMWNGDDAVMVELDSDYHNRTCGLCGDFNGVPVYNEFIHHNRKIHPIEFGNGQRVHRPNDECEDPYEEEELELDAQDLEYPELEDQAVEVPCKEFRPTCEKVIHSEAWSSCASLVDPAPYTQACVQDMCGCGNSTNDFCVCSTLAEFSRQCSHAGGQPPSWRTPQFCAKMCPFNMVYEESGSPCMASCTVSDISSLCEDHKMDGCFCPAGTVWDNISQRGCVSQTECQCKHDKIYNSGEVYRQDSEECLCYQGRWDCKSLPSPATCAVEEGSHVTTFDGKAYIFHGDCHYVLAKIESKDDTSPKFTIFVQLVPCVNQEFDTCLKSVKVLLNNDRNNMLAFSADGKVRHNMQIISLPYNTGDINIFRASSFHILLQTRFGLQIQVQHVPVLQVYVTLEQRYKTKTRGLCGNYNMVLSDDMKTPQGIVEGTASSFGNSWKSSPTCPERDERLESPCSVSVENERYAEHWCSMLTRPDGPFTNCHAMVDPELYHKRCIYATCNCEKTEDCMCAVFSSYARACASKGVFLSDWRVNVCDKYTRGCPESQSFSYKLQRCQWTCRQLSSEQQSCTSDFLPVDGCSCPEGTYQEEHGACVPMNKCPCYHNGVHIKPGKSISIKEQHCLCSNGKLHCRTWKTSSQACPTPKVYLNCSSTDVRDLGVQCARTCRNTESDSCYSTECESGCQCPSGLLDDGKGSCVKEHECPCEHDRTLYASGSEIKDQCNTCTCRKGNWECTEKKCQGTCIIYGSGHYRTFDQRTYGFQGQCAYVAIQNTCGNKSVEDIFRVITENIPCGTTGTTCSKSVRIQLGNKEIKLAKGNYEILDLAMGSEIKYTIRPVGMYLAVEASLGITVLWDRKTTIRILLEPQHSAGVCGLCGDFNGDVQNDFTTQSQMLVSSPLEFANSWKALSSCLDAEASADSCVLQPHRHNWAQIQCSIIKSVTFHDCHKKVNPIPFYENCVKDSCACDSGGDCECFCTAVAAYAQACNEVSVCVAWRTPEICPVFCDYYNEGELCEWHYKPCHEPCYETCRNPHGCNNSIPNLEGCYPVCPEDKPIFDEDKGICVESCDGCIYNGTYYNDNDVIYNVTDNLGMCYYAICKNGKVIETNDPCPTPEPIISTTTTAFITSTTTPTSSPATTPRPTTPLVTTSATTPQTTTTSSSTTEPTTPEVTTRETSPPVSTTTTPPTPTVISTTTSTTTPTVPPSTTVATSTPVITSPTTPLTTRGTTTEPTTTPTVISTTTSTTTAPPSTPVVTPTPVVTTTTTPTQETTSVTTTPSTTTEGTTGIPSTTPCEEECEWTKWFDVDSSTDGSDWETYENITNSGEKICLKPRNITCRSTKAPDKSFDDFVKETGQNVSCDIDYGLICKKKDQDSRPYKCFNYQIKVECCVPCTSPTTPQSTSSTTTEPTTTPTTTSTTTSPPSTPVVTPTTVVTTSTTTPQTTTTSSSTSEPTGPTVTTTETTSPTVSTTTQPTPTVISTTTSTTTPTVPPSTTVVTSTPVITSPTTPLTTRDHKSNCFKNYSTYSNFNFNDYIHYNTHCTTQYTCCNNNPCCHDINYYTSNYKKYRDETNHYSNCHLNNYIYNNCSIKYTCCNTNPCCHDITYYTSNYKKYRDETNHYSNCHLNHYIENNCTNKNNRNPLNDPLRGRYTCCNTNPCCPNITYYTSNYKKYRDETNHYSNCHLNNYIYNNCSTKYTCCNTNPCCHDINYHTSNYKKYRDETNHYSNCHLNHYIDNNCTNNNNYRDHKSNCFKNYSTYSNGHLNDYIHYNPHCTTQYNCCNINTRYHFTYYTSNYKNNNYGDNKPTCFNNYSTYSNGHLNDYIHYNTRCTSQYNCCNINPRYHFTYYTTNYKSNNYGDNKPTCFNNYSTYSNGHLNDYIHYNTRCTSQYNCCNINPRYHFTYYTSNYKSNNYRDHKSNCFNNYSTYSNGHLNDYIHYNPHCTTQYNCCNINPRYHFTYYTSNYKRNIYRDNKSTCFNNYSTYSICHLNNYIYNNTHCTTQYNCCNINARFHITYCTSNNYDKDTTVETLTPVTTVTKPHHSTTTPITTSSTTYESIATGIVTTTTGPTTERVVIPTASSTTETTYTVLLSTTTVNIPTTTTGCVCIVDGKHYKPGETIYDRKDIGSGICLSMICSAICELRNRTEPCNSTPSSTPSPPPMPPLPTCPEWDVTQNETFVLCDCIMAKCIENTTIEIVPYVCPPLEEISCASGKKPVLIDDEYGCCKYYTCPCECEGWGDPHYITFDGVFYSYQGNCTYVLMEEITPKHNLKVIVDNVYCEPTEDVSCPRSIIVSYRSQVITLKNHNLMGAAKMEVLSSGVTVKVPYYHQGIKVLSTGMSLILEIPTLQVVITFGITGFSISLPPREFVNNTKGHCGTCNNNKADDCMLPGGQLIQNCEVMADFYLVEDLYKPSCHAPSVIPTDSPLPPLPVTTCKPDSICGVLLGSLFEACHAIVSPDKFYQGCIFDSCHVANPVVQCTSLQVYAAACAQAGVCLYWRNHTALCPSNCPADKVYKPCGPAEQQTCEDKPGENPMNFTTEGCFCPDGMKLFNKESNICVDKCGCLDSEGVPREFNEIFDQNCQTCICEESTKSVTCKPKDCPAIPAGSCTKPGFILVNQTHPADKCCLHYVCQCDSSTCPVVDLSCDVGYIPEVSVPTGHCCPVRHCLPKAVCLHKGMEYQVGSPVPVVKCQNCTCSRQVIEASGLREITCTMLACDQNCGLGYKYVSDKSLEECCGRCLQTHCVVDRNITQELLKEGETWFPPGNMCESYTCVKIGETLTTIMSNTVCPHFQQSNCYPDTVQTAANGCCKICVEMDKGCKRGSMRQRITHNGCQAREDVDMPYCEGSCNTFARYEEMAAGLEHTCACCRESRFSNRTVELECLNGDLVPYTYVHVEECSCGNTNCNRAARLPARKRRANIGV
ncbi:mucin-2-like [Gadus macrocephalus]|uniref:mucin-2-like n=1 Tax=Gadus macrocephalus TaxID=80720 RepID=UPI0028CBA73D|nr:mucin-2-like [Gadus macrocephalus]